VTVFPPKASDRRSTGNQLMAERKTDGLLDRWRGAAGAAQRGGGGGSRVSLCHPLRAVRIAAAGGAAVRACFAGPTRLRTTCRGARSGPQAPADAT